MRLYKLSFINQKPSAMETVESNGVENGHDDEDKGPSLKVTFDEYKQIASLLVIHLRRKEEELAEGMIFQILIE